jgi:hypothetical protein
MHNAINDSKRPGRNITWQAQPHPAYCAHQFEVIAHLLSAALRRAFNCGSLEAE